MIECDATGCGKPVKGRGLCSSHYAIMWRRDSKGLQQRPGPNDASPEDKFWGRVAVGAEHDCWEWQGYVTPAGYGKIKRGDRTVYVHRYAYELKRGPIPEGLAIDHMCHVRACVNPTHLQPVTKKENSENLVGAIKTSRSGVRGVYAYKGSWRAQVVHNGARIHLGAFSTLEEAEKVAIACRNELYTNNLYDPTTIEQAS